MKKHGTPVLKERNRNHRPASDVHTPLG